MIRKTFVTNMPDKSGAFLCASKIIAEHDGNIVRVSYNKAVDPHMLFLDIEAPIEKLKEIENELLNIGYLNDKISETRVIEVSIKIPDRPGAVLPVLKILNKYKINISYLNSFGTDEPYQNFKLGLLIENTAIVKTLLDKISEIYQIDIIECENSEENLDNTVFYIRLANEMQQLLGLDSENTMKFISESNRILQALQTDGENAGKVFDYIRRFARFISDRRGDKFDADIEKIKISGAVTLFNIQPHCGSNTYVLETPNELVIIDSGYAIYAKEMLKILKRVIPDYNNLPKRFYITHADVDHCGMLSSVDDGQIIVNSKSAESFRRQAAGLPDYRENTDLRLGYSKISRIISGYKPPDLSKLTVFDKDTPANHNDLIKIGNMLVGDLDFTIYEGSGGHLCGEMVYSCPKAGVVFTGDILVNIGGFSKERAEFNSFAPYLMKSVNVDSEKATEMRKQVTTLIDRISKDNNRSCIVCGGHGPMFEFK